MIHLKQYKDGYPLCWPMDREGDFKGSYVDLEVTCPECLEFVKETQDTIQQSIKIRKVS